MKFHLDRLLAGQGIIAVTYVILMMIHGGDAKPFATLWIIFCCAVGFILPPFSYHEDDDDEL